ncbi:MAG TPA: hypothetical protein V6C50_14510 [Crinalium sp.]
MYRGVFLTLQAEDARAGVVELKAWGKPEKSGGKAKREIRYIALHSLTAIVRTIAALRDRKQTELGNRIHFTLLTHALPLPEEVGKKICLYSCQVTPLQFQLV